MRKILCVCNTYFQLITAIQMKLTMFKMDEVTLLLSDHSNNSEIIFQRVLKMEFFEHCYYIRTKIGPKGKTELRKKITDLKSFITGRDKRWEFIDLDFQDEIIYYNELSEIYSLFAYLSKKNPNLKVSRMEEGILSYRGGLHSNRINSVAKPIRRILGMKTIEEAYHNFYCFYPELYTGDFDVKKIPEIEKDSEISNIVSKVFQADFLNTSYDFKYIYFSSVYDAEGGEPIGELKLIKKIADLVGRDNLLVKVHPRDDIARFEKEGLKVDTNSSIPWEAVQLGRDFSNHVFLTTNSTSAISVSLLQENPPKVFYMYKLCDISKNTSAQESVKVIESVLKSDFVKERIVTIQIAEGLQDIIM